MLVRCPDCGHDVSDQAPACIHCGRPLTLLQEAFPAPEMPVSKKKAAPLSKTQQNLIAFVAVIIVLVVIGLVAKVNNYDVRNESTTKPSKTSETAKPAYIPLKASVGSSSTEIRVINKDSFVWQNVELELNSGVIRSGYKLRVRAIDPGNLIAFNMSDFTKSDGTRFNPSATKAQGIIITCDTPAGRGIYSASQ